MMIPGIIAQANKGIINLFVDDSAAKEVYTDQVEEIGNSGKAIRNLPAVIYNSLSDITVNCKLSETSANEVGQSTCTLFFNTIKSTYLQLKEEAKQ